jgi:hypothetical protein
MALKEVKSLPPIGSHSGKSTMPKGGKTYLLLDREIARFRKVDPK